MSNSFSVLLYSPGTQTRVRSRIVEMRDFIDKARPDLLLLQETHLRPEHSFSIPNYVCYRNDRPNSRPWLGVVLRSSLKKYFSFSCPHPSSPYWRKQLSLHSPSNDQEPFMVASIYIPPNPNYQKPECRPRHFIQNFNTAILAGDYNAKHTSGVAVAVIQEVTTAKIYHQ
ncbi:hypothetical protein TNCV_3099201 [Trichonephila clavipes]|nr:hypothetical protein TNCV_3099201 [Trichonephila clavipes]